MNIHRYKSSSKALTRLIRRMEQKGYGNIVVDRLKRCKQRCNQKIKLLKQARKKSKRQFRKIKRKSKR